MKNLKGIIIGILLFAGIVGGIVFWQANQKVTDPVNTETDATFRFDEIMDMSEDVVNDMNDKTITITGIVWSNDSDEDESTVTLGMNDMNSIICQIDNRHLESSRKLTKGHFVKIKGTMSGHDFDDMLGKTIQMKNCVLTQ